MTHGCPNWIPKKTSPASHIQPMCSEGLWKLSPNLSFRVSVAVDLNIPFKSFNHMCIYLYIYTHMVIIKYIYIYIIHLIHDLKIYHIFCKYLISFQRNSRFKSRWVSFAWTFCTVFFSAIRWSSIGSYGLKCLNSLELWSYVLEKWETIRWDFNWQERNIYHWFRWRAVVLANWNFKSIT